MSPKPLVLALSLAVLSVTPAVAQDHSHGHAQTAGSISAEATEAATTVDAFHAALKAGFGNGRTVNQNTARVGFFQPRQQAQQGTFAAAGLPQKADK